VIADFSGGYANHENPLRMLAQLGGRRLTRFDDARTTPLPCALARGLSVVPGIGTIFGSSPRWLERGDLVGAPWL
jgi:hypothetical protein